MGAKRCHQRRRRVGRANCRKGEGQRRAFGNISSQWAQNRSRRGRRVMARGLKRASCRIIFCAASLPVGPIPIPKPPATGSRNCLKVKRGNNAIGGLVSGWANSRHRKTRANYVDLAAGGFAAQDSAALNVLSSWANADPVAAAGLGGAIPRR